MSKWVLIAVAIVLFWLIFDIIFGLSSRSQENASVKRIMPVPNFFSMFTYLKKAGTDEFGVDNADEIRELDEIVTKIDEEKKNNL